MSELQNRIVQRLATLENGSANNSSYRRHKQLITAAIALYYASGGKAEELKDFLKAGGRPQRLDLAEAVARMVVETAAVSHASDIDMVQAAYNWIDEA